jgi:putative ATP-dependent endonuclease of OLD family
MPIEDNIDVIAVQGLAFKRFLSIAKELSKKRIAIVTDNDGNYEEKIIQKYKDYINGRYPNIKICADSRNEFNTLEPQFVEANMQNLSNLKNIIGITGELSKDEIIKYMENNKTEWALKVFNTQSDFDIPQYINDAINWVKDE